MEFIKKNISIIIFVLIVLVSIIVILVVNNNDSFYEREEDISLKHYDVNEYIPVNISDDQMARIYLQEYVYKLENDLKGAYDLLDENYRNNKFSSYEDFVNYVNSIMSAKTREARVEKYAVTDKTNYRDFDIYDANNNLFIFREEGVLQYKVYFDRYTVEM